MSAARKPTAPPKGKPGGAAPERKAAAPKGPIFTPQVVAVIFIIIIIIGIAVFYTSVYQKYNNEMKTIQGQIDTSTNNIATYKKKIGKLDIATAVNKALREKLVTLDYLFLVDQNSMLPFFEDTLFPIIDASRVMQRGGVMKLESQEYTYQLNMAMNPMATLPRSFFDNPQSTFKVKYTGESNGQPATEPLKTTPNTFLQSYWIKLSEFRGTYEDVKDFISDLQKTRHQIITVHCIKNEEGKNAYSYRTVSTWTMMLTVYFINMEASASGDDPPDPPGSKTC